ncbi:hypothetical protein CASFOL_013120 [Castilleja foliolosa]|uniref:High-affinity nitrate transporter n=1 Tax=Castilleja foliolosa TaxID=1961234 RepID=A0ABD3DJ26_9LAMI
MANHGSLIALILLCIVVTCNGNVLFSSLNRTLVVTASPSPPGQVLKAGEDTITVTWSYNSTFPSGSDSNYRTVKIMLCYAPESQQDRAWRKTVDNLKKDKTCQHKIVSRPYSRSGNNTFTYTVLKDIPTASYFVRAYALDAHDTQLAYGQTTNAEKKTNLFGIQAITGRHVSLDIASICFSGFSILSLFGFFFVEKRKAKALSK